MAGDPPAVSMIGRLRSSAWLLDAAQRDEAADIIQGLLARVEAAERKRDDMHWALGHLIYAAQGGNADRGNADLLHFLADRLQTVYSENPNTDYIMALRERATMLGDALKVAQATLSSEETSDVS